MPVTNGKFSKPIRLEEDLANFFGMTANLGYIIANASINIWAKYKPFRRNGTNESTDQDFKNASYGIEVSSYNGEITNTNMPNGDQYWVYARPRGVQFGEWFRALDFNRYNHNAACPFNTGVENTLEVVNDKLGTVLFRVTPNLEGCELYPQDFLVTSDIGICWLYAVFYKSNGDRKIIARSAKRLGEFQNYDEDYYVETNITYWGLDTYKVYLFLSEADINEDPLAEGNVKYLFPKNNKFQNPFNLKIVRSVEPRFNIEVIGAATTRYRFTPSYEPWDIIPIEDISDVTPITSYYGLLVMKFKFIGTKVNSVNGENVRISYNWYDGTISRTLLKDMMCAEVNENDVVVSPLAKNMILINGRTYIVVLDFKFDATQVGVITTNVDFHDTFTNGYAGGVEDFYVDIQDALDDYPITPEEVS